MVRWAKSPWVLGVAASVGAGVPPLVVPAGWPLVWRALIAAVVAGLAGASGSWFGVVLTRAEDAAAARDALEALLDPLVPPSPTPGPGGGGSSVFQVLLPQWCPTRFWGRGAERDRWWQWCQGEATLGLLILEGPGGCGKTRLALRAAGEVAESGWVTGWLGQDRAAGLVEAVAAVPGARVLALVDDADTRTDLGGLLEALAGYRGRARLRVVLIARHGVELAQALQGRMAERDVLLVRNATVVSLRPLGEFSDLVRWYGEATRAFARERGSAVPPLSSTVAPVRAGQPLVEVFAQAMVAVLRHAGPEGSPAPWGEVAGVLFEHEARWWRATAAQQRWGLGSVTEVLLARTMTALALLAPAGQQDAVAALRRVPELADAPTERLANLVGWARALYPGAGGVRIGPDLLADWFITTTLTSGESDREFARHLLGGLGEEQAARVLTVLARAADHYPAAGLLFEQLLGGDPVRLIRHAIYAALTATRRRDLDHTTAAALTDADLDPDTTATLIDLVPAHALPRTALALARRHLHHTRTTGTPTDLARALTNLGAALERLGQHTEQLQVVREAVELLGRETADQPAYQPNLATALTNLGVALGRLGQHTEGLRVARESVELNRREATDNPAHRPELARALTSLSAALERLGQHAEQLEVMREAVELLRREAADNPAHQLALAAALTNLAGALHRVGQHTEELQVARESVELYRGEAADNLAYRLELARALIGLGVALGRLGQHTEQLQVTREAVELNRREAADNPAYQPDLARALNHLVGALHRVGQHLEGLQVAREAVELLRQEAADNPAHQSDLAIALTNLAGTLGQLGQHTEQLQVMREAVTVLQELAIRQPDQFSGRYADSRGALQRLLAQRGDEGDAITLDL